MIMQSSRYAITLIAIVMMIASVTLVALHTLPASLSAQSTVDVIITVAQSYLRAVLITLPLNVCLVSSLYVMWQRAQRRADAQSLQANDTEQHY